MTVLSPGRRRFINYLLVRYKNYEITMQIKKRHQKKHGLDHETGKRKTFYKLNPEKKRDKEKFRSEIIKPLHIKIRYEKRCTNLSLRE